jgi:hypothetical protein
MKIIGNFDLWAPAFPNGLLPQVFSLILNEWPNFIRPTGKPIENRITNRFVGHLRKHFRGKVSFAFSYRDKLPDSESDSESGELDIVVRHGIDLEVYFAFECKRLNVADESGQISSYASKYTGAEGMGCFLTGQYDGGSNCGGMIGYVMDNDILAATKAVDTSLSKPKRSKALRLKAPYARHVTEIMPEEKRVTQTKHVVKSDVFLVYHLFLPYSPPK